jgi:hypothetical protein
MVLPSSSICHVALRPHAWHVRQENYRLSLAFMNPFSQLAVHLEEIGEVRPHV